MRSDSFRSRVLRSTAAGVLLAALATLPAWGAAGGGWFFDPESASVGDHVTFFGVEGEEVSGQLCTEMTLGLAPEGILINSRTDSRLTPVSGTYRVRSGADQFLFVVPSISPGRYTGWFWCDAFSGSSTGVLTIVPRVPATDAVVPAGSRDGMRPGIILAAGLGALGALLALGHRARPRPPARGRHRG